MSGQVAVKMREPTVKTSTVLIGNLWDIANLRSGTCLKYALLLVIFVITRSLEEIQKIKKMEKIKKMTYKKTKDDTEEEVVVVTMEVKEDYC